MCQIEHNFFQFQSVNLTEDLDDSMYTNLDLEASKDLQISLESLLTVPIILKQ